MVRMTVAAASLGLFLCAHGQGANPAVQGGEPGARSGTVSNLAGRAPMPVGAANPTQGGTNAPEPVLVNTALMVTVELEFGGKVPSIAEALRQVERRHSADDGRGRTFAILDAYGEPTPDGKLHMSMHVSMEKPGQGSLVFRRTGEVLWQSRIVTGTNTVPKGPKNLTILVGDGAGKTFLVDGSQNPATLLQATLKDGGVPVQVFWPDGAERELTFLYSTCGCPVKVMAKRTGDRTFRTKDLPVMFPDDPAVVQVINRLMGW